VRYFFRNLALLSFQLLASYFVFASLLFFGIFGGNESALGSVSFGFTYGALFYVPLTLLTLLGVLAVKKVGVRPLSASRWALFVMVCGIIGYILGMMNFVKYGIPGMSSPPKWNMIARSKRLWLRNPRARNLMS
jgi:hypothetical protein